MKCMNSFMSMHMLRVSVFSAGLIVSGYAGSANNTVQLTEQQISNLGIQLGQLTPATQIPVLVAPAKVAVPPAHEYVVSATQGGILQHMQVAVGDTVQKGQVLAQINSPELLNLQRQFLKANNDLALISNSYQRDKKLLQEGVIADRRVYEAMSHYQAALTDVGEAKQLLLIAGMTSAAIDKLASSHQFDSQLTVYAPVTGVVMERMAVPGSRIDTLTPLYRIANLEELWLEINVPQDRVAALHVGDNVVVSNAGVSASIRLLGKSVNPENQTVLVRALVHGQSADIRVGQRVTVQITGKDIVDSFKVPDTAIAQNASQAYIFVRSPAGFNVLAVSVIGKENHEAIIKGEMNGSEQIAVKGAVALKASWLGLGSEE